LISLVRSPGLLALLLALSAPAAAQQSQPSTRALTSGEAIYHAGCAGCHGPSGQGAPDTVVGFDKPSTFPDFTDCPSTTPELDVDWRATIRDGGRGRGFSRIMPSFREELTPQQIDSVIAHLRSLCRDRSYPRGELNLPRPLRTEKAFPESETVVTTSIAAGAGYEIESELAYEKRFTARGQLEIAIPFDSLPADDGARVGGVGDVAFGWKQVLFASHSSIVSGQGEIILPTGNTSKGIGSGVTTFGLFAAYGQLLPAQAFALGQLGTDQPTAADEAPRTLFWRAAFGRSFRQEEGVGRMWSPMLEIVSEREFAADASAAVDLVPQIQVTLNRRQHVRVNAGYQIPATSRAGRPKQVVFYLLWDWFDGGFFEGWK
jgi:hypothetical protein